MSFLKRLFGSKEKVDITNNETFWQWFNINEKKLHRALKEHNNVEEDFLDKIMPRLQGLNENFYCLAGMFDDQTAELIVTAEGDVKSIVFVEELIAQSPQLPNWKFTALKPAVGLDNSNIKMNGFYFNKETISFVHNEKEGYPDEVEITIVHKDYNEEDKNTIINGSYIFLDNFLGELNTATLIDSIVVTGPDYEDGELISIEKLPDYLTWREKEFIEKYEGVRYNTDEDNYAVLEAETEQGLPMIAAINQDLLSWDAKPSHPWMLKVKIEYDGENNNGLPSGESYAIMNEFEDELVKSIPDYEGYLNIGRESYNNVRSIYIACKEFRIVSKRTKELVNKYSNKLKISYDLFKDKYWISVEKFIHQPE